MAIVEPTRVAATAVCPHITAADSRLGLRRSAVLIGWAVFVSTIAQTGPGWLADLPLRALLQDRIGTLRMAAFFAIAMSPWYLKPIAGLLSDAFPLLGTRRRGYLLVGAALAGSLWLLMGAVPATFGAIVIVATAMNAMLVVISTAIGGVLVEEGQRLGATGRLTSTRAAVMYFVLVLSGLLGGLLAARGFFITTIVNGLLLFSLVPVVVLLHREPRTSRPVDVAPLRHGVGQIRVAACSRSLWLGAVMFFLLFLAPGFTSPLFDHLKNDLHYSVQSIGVFQSVSGMLGVIAAAPYAWACRRVSLRTLLVIAILCSAGAAIPFLALGWRLGPLAAYAGSGFAAALVEMTALDLAARATPRGVEAMGYSFMLSAGNASIYLSDIIGSWLWGALHHRFAPLVWINAGSSLLALVALPFLPRMLVLAREGRSGVALPEATALLPQSQ